MTEELPLTAEELHCLAALCDLSQVTGLAPMPFADDPSAEPLLLGTALRSLGARGLIAGDVVSREVADALAVVRTPERALALQRGGEGGIGIRSFWLSGGRAIELRRVAEHDYLLTSFDPAGLADRFVAAAELAGAVNGRVPGGGLRLARAALLAALAGSQAPGLPVLDDASLWEASWMEDGPEPEGGSLSWLDAGPGGAWRIDATGHEDDASPDGLLVLEPVARAALVDELRAAALSV